MRQNALLFLGFLFLVIVLIFVNTVAYRKPSIDNDNEFMPNRSSYNPGTTGTMAFYTLLSESGVNVERWRRPMHDLNSGSDSPNTFVIVGETRLSIPEEDARRILRWVSDGGRLVIIGRAPEKELLQTTADWSISMIEDTHVPPATFDSTLLSSVTHETAAIKPQQPGVYTVAVNAIQPSQFATGIEFIRRSSPIESFEGKGQGIGEGQNNEETNYGYDLQGGYSQPEDQPTNANYNSGGLRGSDSQDDQKERWNAPPPAAPPPPPPPAPAGSPSYTTAAQYDLAANAPIVFFEGPKGKMLVEVPYGAGKIAILSDPFIVSNLGLKSADNAILGINLVGGYEGKVAFDEYHQGFGTGQNMVFQYFQGTPVVAIFLQCCLLLLILFLSQSKRFARALPEYEPDRLSKLEYVSAMAELQHRAKADDLALENIFDDFRRRSARSFGLGTDARYRKELITKLAERSGKDVREVEDLFFTIEEIIRGEPTNNKEMVSLVARLRDLESRSGLKRSSDSRVR